MGHVNESGKVRGSWGSCWEQDGMPNLREEVARFEALNGENYVGLLDSSAGARRLWPIESCRGQRRERVFENRWCLCFW
jgi:hypothetical protein